tara:strand:- start:4737 stop:6236 length:1500 start_codon:yes stop_codon:yes gene_type:complete
MKDFKYTTIFSSEIKPLVPEDKDKYLAMASLVDIGDFIPNLDTDTNYDLLPIAFNACVINRVNKNDDVVDTEHGITMAKHFINKPINVEHNRERVVGTILTAGYSEFGTDKPLTEEQVKDLEGPFNITLGGVVWKVVNSHLAEVIENASDPTSEDYLRVSASWELGFTDYNIAVIEEDEKNIENATIISDNEKVDELKDTLRGFGGEGSLDTGERIYRHVVGEIIPLGIGLTETPAAEVKGVAVKKEEEEEIKAEDDQQDTPENAEKVSHFEEKNVIENKDTSIMKITNINDITDESLKQLKASAVSDFISDEIKKVSDQFEAEKTQREEVIKTTQEKFDQVAENLESVKAELDKMKQEKAEQESLELFNQRMAAFDEEYELNDQIRAHVASDIKDMSEEDFVGYKDKMAAFLSGYDKKTIAAEKAEAEAKATAEAKEVEEAAKQESQEETVEEVVEQAVDNAEEVEQQATPNTTDASDATLYDKYKDAFSIDNFNIKL